MRHDVLRVWSVRAQVPATWGQGHEYVADRVFGVIAKTIVSAIAAFQEANPRGVVLAVNHVGPVDFADTDAARPSLHYWTARGVAGGKNVKRGVLADHATHATEVAHRHGVGSLTGVNHRIAIEFAAEASS